MSYRLERADGVAVLTLDRPPVNALDLAFVDALEAAAARLAEEPPTGLVIIGQGRAFSAGVDVRAFGAYAPAEKAHIVLGITRMIGALYGLPFPVVSAVGGHAMGGGFVLLLAGDVRIAVDDDAVRLGLQEAKAGIPFPAGPLEVIRSELSPELLRRLTLTSVAMTPAEAHALGVIDRLAAREDLVATAVEQVRELAAQPAFALVKRQVRAPALARLRALAESGQDPLIEQLIGG